MGKKIFLAVLVGLAYLSVSNSVRAQDSDKVVILSPRVGAGIDAKERERFQLFEGIPGFGSAIIHQTSKGTYYANILVTSPDGAERYMALWYPETEGESYLSKVAERIDHFEELNQAKDQICVNEVDSGAFAGGGKRKGFIIGGALGVGITAYREKVDYDFGYGYTYSWSRSEDRVALVTDFKVGYAPTDLIQLYCTTKGSWFLTRHDRWLDFLYDVGAATLTGVGLTYSFRPVAPSWFVTCGIGVMTWDDDFEGDFLDGGLGFFLGGGYEFSRHWSIEGNLVGGNPHKYDSGASTTSFRITISFLQY